MRGRTEHLEKTGKFEKTAHYEKQNLPSLKNVSSNIKTSIWFINTCLIFKQFLFQNVADRVVVVADRVPVVANRVVVVANRVVVVADTAVVVGDTLADILVDIAGIVMDRLLYLGFNVSMYGAIHKRRPH